MAKEISYVLMFPVIGFLMSLKITVETRNVILIDALNNGRQGMVSRSMVHWSDSFLSARDPVFNQRLAIVFSLSCSSLPFFRSARSSDLC